MARSARKAGASRIDSGASQAIRAEFICPECGKPFGRPASLGAHRQRAHGVAGRSVRAVRAHKAAARRNGGTTNSRSASGSTSSVDRNGLLATLFPQGIPPRDDLMREIGVWLDHAEHLAHKSRHPRAA